MTQWYVKDLSKITEVSVQALHHYDRIDLLKPSVRLSNGYRLYSEKDLLKLQQIIALKFFGFDLNKIKSLLAAEIDVLMHFSAQARSLEEKGNTLLQASKTLKTIISDCSKDKSIPWEAIIKLIEVYRMTEKLENRWAAKVFNPEELKEYVNFEKNLKTRFTDSEIQTIQHAWSDIVNEVNANLDEDPEGKFGIQIGKRTMDWVNKYFGEKYISLRNAVWNKKFKSGEVETGEDNPLSPEAVVWLDKAMSAYYRDRIHNILSQVGRQSHDVVLKLWKEVMTDICGDNQSRANEIIDVVMKDSDISQDAKMWLKQVSK